VGDVRKTLPPITGFEDGRIHDPKKRRQILDAKRRKKKKKKQIFPRTSKKEHSPDNILILAQ